MLTSPTGTAIGARGQITHLLTFVCMCGVCVQEVKEQELLHLPDLLKLQAQLESWVKLVGGGSQTLLYHLA